MPRTAKASSKPRTPARAAPTEISRKPAFDASPGVRIELTGAQIRRVIDDLAQSRGMLSLLLDFHEGRTRSATAWLRGIDDPRMARSLARGLFVLASMPSDGAYIGVTDLARTVGMNTGTAHRYVRTLHAATLVEQHPATRKYRLAPDETLPEVPLTQPHEESDA